VCRAAPPDHERVALARRRERCSWEGSSEGHGGGGRAAAVGGGRLCPEHRRRHIDERGGRAVCGSSSSSSAGMAYPALLKAPLPTILCPITIQLSTLIFSCVSLSLMISYVCRRQNLHPAVFGLTKQIYIGAPYFAWLHYC
jgi:hypothetical protein